MYHRLNSCNAESRSALRFTEFSQCNSVISFLSDKIYFLNFFHLAFLLDLLYTRIQDNNLILNNMTLRPDIKIRNNITTNQSLEGDIDVTSYYG